MYSLLLNLPVRDECLRAQVAIILLPHIDLKSEVILSEVWTKLTHFLLRLQASHWVIYAGVTLPPPFGQFLVLLSLPQMNLTNFNKIYSGQIFEKDSKKRPIKPNIYFVISRYRLLTTFSLSIYIKQGTVSVGHISRPKLGHIFSLNPLAKKIKK